MMIYKNFKKLIRFKSIKDFEKDFKRYKYR